MLFTERNTSVIAGGATLATLPDQGISGLWEMIGFKGGEDQNLPVRRCALEGGHRAASPLGERMSVPRR
jgi:hypothetical protein